MVNSKTSFFKPYLQLTRLDRPIGILLLLWPTLMALWIAAEGLPDIKLLLIFTLGVVLMRSAGCAINDFADRDLDGEVWRTENRPLATGVLKPWQAMATFIVLALLKREFTLWAGGFYPLQTVFIDVDMQQSPQPVG